MIEINYSFNFIIFGNENLQSKWIERYNTYFDVCRYQFLSRYESLQEKYSDEFKRLKEKEQDFVELYGTSIDSIYDWRYDDNGKKISIGKMVEEGEKCLEEYLKKIWHIQMPTEGADYKEYFYFLSKSIHFTVVENPDLKDQFIGFPSNEEFYRLLHQVGLLIYSFYVIGDEMQVLKSANTISSKIHEDYVGLKDE